MNPPSLLTGLGAAIGADPGGSGTSGRAGTPGASDLFLSLVAGLLQGDRGGRPPTGTTTPEPAGTPVAPEPDLAVPQPGAEDEQAEPVTGDAASVVPTLTAIIAQAMTAASTPAVAPLANQAGAGSATGAAETQEGGADGVEAAVTGATAATPATAAVDQTRGGVPTTGAATTEATPAASTTPTAPDDASAETPVDTATPLAAQQGARTDAAPPPTAPVSVIPVTATAAPAAVSVATAPPTEAQRITGQVFPEVVRVAAAPGGTQRVTVRLNPETLGEVRVILTHHRGELEVSLAGGEAARRALTEGAPELRRLLESVGRADSRIVIRDLPGTSPTPVPAAVQDGSALRTDVSTDLGGNAWSGAGRPGGESAADQETARYRIPGSTNATDGTRDSTIPSRPSTTDASGRLGGLDVSI